MKARRENIMQLERLGQKKSEKAGKTDGEKYQYGDDINLV